MMFPILLFPEWAPEDQYEEIILLKKINMPLRRTGRGKKKGSTHHTNFNHTDDTHVTGLMYKSVNAPVHLP